MSLLISNFFYLSLSLTKRSYNIFHDVYSDINYITLACIVDTFFFSQDVILDDEQCIFMLQPIVGGTFSNGVARHAETPVSDVICIGKCEEGRIFLIVCRVDYKFWIGARFVAFGTSWMKILVKNFRTKSWIFPILTLWSKVKFGLTNSRTVSMVIEGEMSFLWN